MRRVLRIEIISKGKVTVPLFYFQGRATVES